MITKIQKKKTKMKINFTNEERFLMGNLIERYHKVNVELEEDKKKANEIMKRIEDCSIKLKEISDEEKTLMEELHKKYGDFTLQDINDSIYEQ